MVLYRRIIPIKNSKILKYFQNGECKNNMPGFTCICNEGYTIDETGTKCIGEFAHMSHIQDWNDEENSIFRVDENNLFFIKTLMSAKRIHVSPHPNAETLMVVMNANVHLVSSKKMAFVWMSTNASKFLTT